MVGVCKVSVVRIRTSKCRMQGQTYIFSWCYKFDLIFNVCDCKNNILLECMLDHFN